MHFNTCEDGAYLHSHTSKWEKYTYQIFADKCDEDTWGMEERQEGAEERRELTGTSFQYQRVGHCQKKGKRKGNRKTAKWRLGGQHKHWYHKGEVFLCVMDKNTREAEEVESGSSKAREVESSHTDVGMCEWGWFKLFSLWGNWHDAYMNMNGEDLMSL